MKKKDRKKTFAETVARIIFLICAVVSILAVVSITFYMIKNGLPAFQKVGIKEILFETQWMPTAKEPLFGIAFVILTSVVGTFAAILFGVPIALLTAVFLVEVAPKRLAGVVKPAVELLAGIPSVIYGLLGIMILNPLMYQIELAVFKNSATHQFTGGSNLLSAVIVLTIMILPTVVTMTESALRAVPASMKAASLALGATKIQTVFRVLIPAAKSGIAKSTFLKSINRMNDLVDGVRIEGIVTLDGDNIYDADIDKTLLRKKVGMVFQQPNPFPMSIYDNVAYGPRVHGIKNKSELDAIVERSLRGAAIFDEVKDRLRKSALSLSGGQQQRLCIARALAVEPEVILMDEPTSALDPISTAKIEDLMEELKKKYTVVVVTHNMQQAARISEDTAFFLMGDMIEFNSTKEIFQTPKDTRTADYIMGRMG